VADQKKILIGQKGVDVEEDRDGSAERVGGVAGDGSFLGLFVKVVLD
jgi:GTPase Era involved in 16S rRNA processing